MEDSSVYSLIEHDDKDEIASSTTGASEISDEITFSYNIDQQFNLIENKSDTCSSISNFELESNFDEFGFMYPSTRHFPSKLAEIFTSIVCFIFLPIEVIGSIIFLVIKHLE